MSTAARTPSGGAGSIAAGALTFAKKRKEDSALRIFVVFDRGGGLISPPDTIAYGVGQLSRKGRIQTSERFDNVKYVVVADGAKPGLRVTFKRDLKEDYRRAFGREAPAIKAIGIKSDANNTGLKASATLYRLELGSR